ncbi:MAG: hypothetical protein OH318_02055 [Candidatus Parvarchaeota archaeon]|nr:hypothetical protein [Candidatus Rehaiarchaeum fermentans]MCW1293492.1 hypothetical protein [Candidatus Rehaiarchaeum fermentans]
MIKEKLSNLLWRFSEYYTHNYKILIAVPLIIIFFSVSVLTFKYITTGKIIKEGISLTGGYQITVPPNTNISLIKNYSPIAIRGLFSSKIIGYQFSAPLYFNKTLFLEELEKYNISQNEVTINYVGPQLVSSAIYNAIVLFIIAFVLVSFVSFIYFRSYIQSFANVISIVSDVINVLAIMSFLGLSLSTASIAGFLMLIGYSADRNAILSSNLFKRKEGNLQYRIYHTLKTSITMDVSAISVLIVMLLISSSIIKDIATVLIIGVILDDLVVWILNGGLQIHFSYKV